MDENTFNSRQVIQSALLFFAEKITNACLLLDPGTRERLHKLNGSCLAFHLQDQFPFYSGGITVFVLPTGSRIELSSDTRCVADVSISLRAKDLLTLLNDVENIPEHIIIQGDDELLIHIMDIAQKLDLDWEAALSQVTGDIIAHNIGDRVRNTENWMRSSYQEVKRLADEYLSEELPVAGQSEPFKGLKQGINKIKQAGDSLKKGWDKK